MRVLEDGDVPDAEAGSVETVATDRRFRPQLGGNISCIRIHCNVRQPDTRTTLACLNTAVHYFWSRRLCCIGIVFGSDQDVESLRRGSGAEAPLKAAVDPQHTRVLRLAIRRPDPDNV